MDKATFAAESAVEMTHWWFAGRRRLFATLIGELGLRQDAAILDVGTSTGTNLRMLRDMGFSRISGIDPSPEAIRFCKEKGLGDVQMGDVCALPFSDSAFELVLATDIIEHVDNERGALRELRRVLKPDGMLLVTVPAFRLLWGLQDEVSHHRRRYRMKELLGLIRESGFTPSESFYFNYLLFAPILLARQFLRLSKLKIHSENQLNPSWLNGVLSLLFRFDVWSARRLHPPIGVSALVMAAKVAG